MHHRPASTRVGAQGRVVLPAGIREALDLRPGTPLIPLVEGGAVLLLAPEEAVRRARAAVARHVDPARRLAAELLRERREGRRRR